MIYANRFYEKVLMDEYDSDKDIIKIDNDEIDLKKGENSKNKTDDNLPEKEIPSQKEFIIENNKNNKNTKKRRTIATTIVPEPRENKNKFQPKSQNNINEIKEEDAINEISNNKENPKDILNNIHIEKDRRFDLCKSRPAEGKHCYCNKQCLERVVFFHSLMYCLLGLF